MPSEIERIPPADCASLDEIREGMDAIDRQIVSLMAERVSYVREAAKFKTSSTGVAAPERVAAVLKTRRDWAESAGLDGDLIETLYRQLVNYCISEEHKRWHEING
jgi:isochorismate pyruvate lyase